MNATSLRRRGQALRRVLSVATVAVLGAAGAAVVQGAPATADPPPRNGIVCTPGTTSTTTSGTTTVTQRVFDLTTRTGYIDLPDGNTAFMWGYSSGFDPFQHPGPVLCAHAGEVVTVVLHNTFTEETSIVFPGMDGVLANGVPSQPPTSAGLMTSLAPGAAGVSAGNPPSTIAYTFTASRAGTYLYESGTNPEKQVRMGLFGALIVRPSTGDDYAYDNASDRFTASEEFMVLLSEIDPYQHQAAEAGKNFNLNNYKPRYWLINGRGYPDSIADNGASWLPNQPYGSLASVKPYQPDPTKPGYHPLGGLARYLSVGSEDYPFHPHGNNGLVVGRDGHEPGQRRQRPVHGEVRHQHRPGADVGRALQVVRRRGLRTEQPRGHHRPRPRQPGRRHVLLRQPLPGRVAGTPAGRADAQPVRRVLHHQPQPRAVPDHLVGRDDDRSHHVHADRTAQRHELRLRRGD